MFISGWTDKEGNSITWQPLGVFVNPKNDDEWSSYPYNKEQMKAFKAEQRFIKTKDKIINHLVRTSRSINEEIELIKKSKSTLPRYCKDFLLNVNIECTRCYEED
jgi:hypothetical protein